MLYSNTIPNIRALNIGGWMLRARGSDNETKTENYYYT